MLSKSLFFGALATVALVVVQSAFSAEGDELKFKVQGTNPGGKGGYTGQVTVAKTSNKQSARLRWVTGANKAVTEGIGIRTQDGIIGAGYGGKSFYALAVYQLDGNRIHAHWALATTPEDVGTYDLKSPDFVGNCKFADGTPGSVTFTEGKNGVYKITWDLPTGQYQGVGLRIGDALVAASGDIGGGFGVVALQTKGDEISGVWTTTGSGGVGKETWTMAEDQKMPEKGGAIGDGKSVEFGGETYALKDAKSAPGRPTSELREYLRKGEDWEGYRKMVAFRMQHGNASASEFAEGILAQTKKEYPECYTKVIESGDKSATFFFIIVKGDDVEFDLWNIRRTKDGLPSAQFVLRNKPPYDTKQRFKAEQDKNFDEWVAQIKKLGGQAESYIEASADSASTPSQNSAAAKDKGVDPILVKAIQEDMQKCVGIAQDFMGLIQEGKPAQAAKLLGDSAFKKVTREEFTAGLEKSSKILGALKNYTPDKGATDFGVKNKVMTFTLQADAEYENGKVREILTFIRNSKGEVEFVDYVRKPKA
jgi:hypothetical protein